jgi:uncharacterized protein YgiM (DUF1202 family)
MRYLYSALAVVTLSLTLMLAFGAWQPTAAHAQANATVTILADRLNIRSGPGTGYSVAASAKKGEKYTVTGQNGNCAWLKIASGGKALGWVSGGKSFVKLNGACSSIPGAGASSAGSAAAPAAGKGKQGCALLINKLKTDVKLSVKRSDGWQSSWSIPAGGQDKACVDPGSYTATFTASGLPGNMAFPVTVKGGEYYEIPLSLPGS